VTGAEQSPDQKIAYDCNGSIAPVRRLRMQTLIGQHGARSAALCSTTGKLRAARYSGLPPRAALDVRSWRELSFGRRT
jgi:hypothetical protein